MLFFPASTAGVYPTRHASSKQANITLDVCSSCRIRTPATHLLNWPSLESGDNNDSYLSAPLRHSKCIELADYTLHLLNATTYYFYRSAHAYFIVSWLCEFVNGIRMKHGHMVSFDQLNCLHSRTCFIKTSNHIVYKHYAATPWTISTSYSYRTLA